MKTSLQKPADPCMRGASGGALGIKGRYTLLEQNDDDEKIGKNSALRAFHLFIFLSYEFTVG